MNLAFLNSTEPELLVTSFDLKGFAFVGWVVVIATILAAPEIVLRFVDADFGLTTCLTDVEDAPKVALEFVAEVLGAFCG